MLKDRVYSVSVMNRSRSIVSTAVGVVRVAGWVTVLLLLVGGHSVTHGKDVHGTDLSVFQFSCQFQFLMGPGRLDGLMVSNGSRQRIAIYWIEPDVFRESSAFVRYCDFILTADTAYYWIHPGVKRGTLSLSYDHHSPLLPREDSVESIIRSALTIASRMDPKDHGRGIPLEVGKFFHGSRGLSDYAYEAVPGRTDSNDPSATADSDVQTLNALPGGRAYSKERRSDRTVVWHAKKASYGSPVAEVTVEAATRVQESDCPGVFDPETLGLWTLVPEAYRVYWSFDRGYSDLSNGPDARGAACELHDRIESYLNGRDLPVQLRRGMDRLTLKAALATGDISRVRRSAQAAVAGLFEDASMGKYRAFLELARIGGQIQQRYPEQPQEWLRPLVGQMVKHVGSDIGSYLDRLLPIIDANRWFTYGALLLDEVRRQDLLDESESKQMAARFEAMRLVGDGKPPDTSEPCVRVRDYLARLDADPPRGPLDMNNVRHILEQGLEEYCRSKDSPMKPDLVEDILRSVRLIAGDGPFCGNQEKLAAATARFSERFRAIYGSTTPINMVLATFLALSFCDISTPEDHAVLVAQFHNQCAALETHVRAMLTQAGLEMLVGPNEVERAFAACEQIFREYVDDPLWPPFKFPLTSNEEARLAATLKLRLMQLQAILEEMSLKVKYGGVSVQLQERTVFEISHLARQLLPQAAFLRKPAYPGVACQYRGGRGFTAAIDGGLYLEGARPKEKFKVMKYFHLGNRLEGIVEEERESMMSAMKAAKQREAPTMPRPIPVEPGATNDDAQRSEHIEPSSPKD